MPLSQYAKDKYVAHEISKFKHAKIKRIDNIIKSSKNWITNYILNNLLRYNLPSPLNQYIFNFMRRAQGSVILYEQARRYTIAYLRNVSELKTSKYFRAVLYWELFTMQAYESFILLADIVKRAKIFDKGDNSAIERLGKIYTNTKHASKIIKSRGINNKSTIPMWLKNDGLVSYKCKLSFEEANLIIKDIAKSAQVLIEILSKFVK